MGWGAGGGGAKEECVKEIFSSLGDEDLKLASFRILYRTSFVRQATHLPLRAE